MLDMDNNMGVGGGTFRVLLVAFPTTSIIFIIFILTRTKNDNKSTFQIKSSTLILWQQYVGWFTAYDGLTGETSSLPITCNVHSKDFIWVFI